MYDKSKAEMLEYIKKQDDEIKALNNRIDFLRETTRMNTEDIKQLREKYSYQYWDIKALEDENSNMKMDYSRMERKLKFNSISIYVQPFVWTAGWLFAQWLLRG